MASGPNVRKSVFSIDHILSGDKTSETALVMDSLAAIRDFRSQYSNNLYNNSLAASQAPLLAAAQPSLFMVHQDMLQKQQFAQRNLSVLSQPSQTTTAAAAAALLTQQWKPETDPMYHNLYLDTIMQDHTVHNPWAALFATMPFHKRKGGQVRFTNEQTVELEKRFATQKYLSPSDRKKVAKKLQLSERQVKTWFQNRRAKWRRLRQDSKQITKGHGHIILDTKSHARVHSCKQTNSANSNTQVTEFGNVQLTPERQTFKTQESSEAQQWSDNFSTSTSDNDQDNIEVV